MRKHTIFSLFFKLTLILLISQLFNSCVNDVETVKMLTVVDSLPAETIKDLSLIQSENGIISFKLSGKTMNSYDKPEQYIEFPDGVHVIFYDTLKNIKSELTANYGISYEKKKLMEAKYDVEVINYETKERLNTEHLIWDRNKKKITSEVFVKITTEDKTIYGQNGLEADEQFESWKLKKVKGDIMVDQDKY